MTGSKIRMFIPKIGEFETNVGSGTPYTVDATQKYPLGTYMRMGDRTFAYAKAGGTLNPAFGALNNSLQHIVWSAVPATYAAGVTKISVTTSDTAGAAANGTIAANELVGGYIMVMPTGNADVFIRQVVGNTAVVNHSHTMYIDLDSPTPCILTAATANAEVMASQYLNVLDGNTNANNWRSIVGMPTMPATVGQFCWLQTWGPVWAAVSADAGVGSNVRQLIFGGNGSIDTHDHTGGNFSAQHAGFTLTNGAAGIQGAPFFFLQITP